MASDMEKVVIDLPAGEQTTAEVVWGRQLSENQYELRSVPVFAYGLAYCDVVETKPGHDDRRHFVKLLRPSGLLTVRAAGPKADRALFGNLCQALAASSEATEHYSDTYSAFSLTYESYQRNKPAIEDAERADAIFVEVANGDE